MNIKICLLNRHLLSGVEIEDKPVTDLFRGLREIVVFSNKKDTARF